MEQDIIFITGANGNIAMKVIEKYLDNGNIVVATDIQEKSAYKKFETNKNYAYYQLDVTKVDKMQKLYKIIETQYGRITHIISAAGGPIRAEIDGIENVTIEEIDKSVQLNLTSHIYITKEFLPLIEKEKNINKSIVLISSINALRAFNLPIYSAAKAGIYGFMNSMTKELGKKSIRINAVSPGTVPTKKELESNGNFHNYKYKNMLALKEFTKPEDIADTIFSLTHITKAITGQKIIVDSGQIA